MDEAIENISMSTDNGEFWTLFEDQICFLFQLFFQKPYIVFISKQYCKFINKHFEYIFMSLLSAFLSFCSELSFS